MFRHKEIPRYEAIKLVDFVNIAQYSQDINARDLIEMNLFQVYLLNCHFICGSTVCQFFSNEDCIKTAFRKTTVF